MTDRHNSQESGLNELRFYFFRSFFRSIPSKPGHKSEGQVSSSDGTVLLGPLRTGLHTPTGSVLHSCGGLVENRKKDRNNLSFSAMFLRMFTPKPCELL